MDIGGADESKFELLWGHMAKNYSNIQQCHALCLLSAKVYNVDTPGQVSPYILPR